MPCRVAARQIKAHAGKLRGDVNTHAPPLRGTIARLSPGRATAHGRKIFFRSNAVVQ
jgi:hypothetical protein